jgi:nucleotide-binding universal stress UspA family protein
MTTERSSTARPAPRVLLAVDGSEASEHAIQVAAALSWPSGTVITVLTAVHDLPRAGGEVLSVTPDDASRIEALFTDAARLEGRPAPQIRRVLVEGTPERAIVDAARRLRVQLIVVGSRGHGALATTLLGSVAATVADRADRPVLIARAPTARRILLAADGSSCGTAAEEWLLRWPLFASSEVRVVSVAPFPVAPGEGPGHGVREGATAGDAGTRASEEANRIAFESHARLAEAGIAASVEVREGDAAGEILGAANEWADLVVVGCRGRTGLRRLVLGSVSRAVMVGARCSVLVIKERSCC